MSMEQTAIDQADFEEMSIIAEQHTKKEDDVTCSDVRELEEARARIVELEAHCIVQHKAHNNLLNDCINFNGGKLSDCFLEQSTSVLLQTPQQSLAEIQAKAIEDSAEFTKEKMIYSVDVPYMCDPRKLEVYANQLRAKAK